MRQAWHSAGHRVDSGVVGSLEQLDAAIRRDIFVSISHSSRRLTLTCLLAMMSLPDQRLLVVVLAVRARRTRGRCG